MSAPLEGGMTPLKRALLSIEKLQDKVRLLEGERTQPIAIVGAGCRFPGGGNDPESFFSALLEGRDAITPAPPVPRPGWAAHAVDAPLPPAGYLDVDVRGFDAPFFGISPREATSIDPQHRLFLECAWEALESAGINPRGLEGSRSGVFVGMAGNDYAQMQLRSERASELLHSHFAAGIGHSMVSGRLSYLLGLHGPSVTIDTACSSSLVAVHLACQSLRTGETELAIAGGVNLILATDYTIAFQQSRMLSSDGRCRTFDDAADGFSRAEGCGVIVLKRLTDAQRDGDRILGVIRASAVNQDGPSSGLTAPNGPAQEAVIRAALRQAGLRPRDIGYIEAHGTGTPLGDPVEVQALGAVFSDDRPADQPLLVGSVKTNLGHLEAAAGMAGLIKLVESLRHREIPAHLHLRTPNSHIPWEDLPVAVPTVRMPFPVTGDKRRGGVSSFGFSGTNAHVIVEEAPGDPADEPGDSGARATVLTISAADDNALRALAGRYVDHLERSPARFADVCLTANAGRAALPRRLALVASDAIEAKATLDGWLRGETVPALRTARLRSTDRPRIAFLFTGQGSQYAGMGWSLSQQSDVFRRAIASCDDILRSDLEIPLVDLLNPSSVHAELLNRTDYTQPALFALQYALCALWRSWGVEPAVVAGHSIGEYAAAHLAGVFTLEDALRLVALRGRLMQGVSAKGRMEAVFATEDRVREWVAAVNGTVSVAGINASDQIVVSGTPDAVEAVLERARREGVTTKPLRTSHAFHSPLMEDVATAFASEVARTPRGDGRGIRFVSTLTGKVIAPDELTQPAYWSRQLREPVRFADAARVVADLADIAVEIGPHPALAGLVAQSGTALPVSPSLQREKDEWTTIRTAQRDLYLAGVSLDWNAATTHAPRTRAALPTYPFQRIPLWVDLGTSGRAPEIRTGHPLLGSERPQPGDVRVFERTLSVDAPAFIGEHRVLGRALLPGTAFLEMVLAAGREALNGPVEVRDLDLVEPMVFTGDTPRRVHSRLERTAAGGPRITIHSTEEPVDAKAIWSLHAAAHVGVAEPVRLRVDLAAVRARCLRHIEAPEFRETLRSRGYDFGPRLQGVVDVLAGSRDVLGEIRLPDACADDLERYVAHPLILDAGLQIVSAALGDRGDSAFVPMAIGRVLVGEDVAHTRWVHAEIVEQRPGTVVATATFLDDDGTVVATIERVTFRELPAATLDHAEDPFLQVRWIEDTRDVSGDMAGIELLAASEVSDLLRSTLRRLADAEDAEAYDRSVDALEAEAAGWVRYALAALGWNASVGTTISLDDASRAFGIAPKGRRLLGRAFDILADEGVLEISGGAWRVLRPLSPFNPPPALASSNGHSPEEILLRRCGPHLAAGLRATIDPLELLFPGGDGTLAEEMYFNSPMARVLNSSIAEVLARLVQRVPQGSRLRVLEIGGGTAGTTRRVVERLLVNGELPRSLSYTFTDVSPMFVERAKRRFRDLAAFEFDTFDLDRPAAEHEIALGSFDVIIAANCLHAARDLTKALAGVGRLLKPGGLLLAAEVFAPHRWFDLTVGLTDGWWHFTDTDLRPSYACVSPETWATVLERAGFTGTSVISVAEAAGTKGHASRHQGLVASFRSHVTSATPTAAGWLFVDDASTRASALADSLTAAGIPVHRIRVNELALAPDAAAEVAAVLQTRSRWEGVLHCTEVNGAPDRAAAPLDSRLRDVVGSLLSVSQAVTGSRCEVGRLCILTCNAQAIVDSDAELNAVAAAAWGLARAISLEAPDLPCFALDVDHSQTAHITQRIVTWMRSETAEPEVGFRGASRLVPRLEARSRRSTAGELPDEYRLAPTRRGSIEYLEFAPGERAAPAPGQVEIRVAASSLNFKDVLNVLGMYPGEPGPLGSECAGVVSRVGSGVDFKVGDEVIASAGGSHGRHVIADSALVARKPSHLTFVEASTLPVAYLTAHFALSHLGRLRAGDRVLIHAAAGGVGLAACALARRAGAEIYATAGSEEKRQYLRDLGIRHFFDSRSPAFADAVMAATEGRGVTVVLNSLADEFVERSFSVLANGGRFLEIGKRGVWTPEQVRALGRDIEYHLIDWGETARQDPALMQRLFGEIVAAVQAGELHPLPATTFPLVQMRDAFRYMAQAKHIGKIVMQHPVLRPAGSVEFHTDATYLITGGLSGLGLETARWACERGARSLVLTSRTESDETRAVIDELRAGGADVRVWCADVGDAAQVQALVDRIRRELLPLRGVIHAAGALADRTLQSIAWDDFALVARAKIVGTVLLTEATRDCPLDFFVAYSSIAGVFGSPGQANHSAANAFMDAYVAGLWRGNRLGMSIAWGPWRDTGAAARENVLERNRQRGLEPLATRDGLQQLARAFARPAALLVGARITDPEALGGNRHRRFLERISRPRVASPSTSAAAPTSLGAQTFADQLAAQPAGVHRTFVVNRVKARVRAVLGLPTEFSLEAQRPLGELGLDSLLAIELRNVLGEDAGRRLPATLLFDHPTIDSLSDHLLSVLEPHTPSTDTRDVEPPGVPAPSSDPFASVESMSDEEVDRLLAAKLGSA